MFYIDNDSGVTVMPPVSAQRSAIVRWFSEGDGNNVITWPGMDWFNIVQAELLNTLEEAGIQPDKTKLNQLALSIKSIMSNNALLIKNNLSEIKTAGALAQRTARENLDIYDASLNKKGLVQLTSATDSPSETLAATAKAVKIAMDNANARLAKDRNGADIPNKPLFIQNLDLQETVNRAGNAVQKNGDTLSGGLTFENDSILAWIRNTDWAKIGFKNDADGDTDSYMWFETGDNGNEYFKWRSRQSTTTKDLMTLKWDALNILVNAVINGSLGVGTTNALGGSSIVLGDNDTGFKQNGDGILDVYANSQRVFRFQNGVAIAFKNIQAGDSKKFSLSSSNTSTKNATFNLWGASTRPVVAELGDEAGWHFYSQRNTDNSVIFSVNGQIQPSNWGNFDSRYVKDVRLGTRVVQLMARGGRYEKAGHAITGLRIIGEVDGDDEAIFRPIQKYINGTWYNVAQV
ncbi:TPA: phage tail protein [Escherichia coli]